MTLLSRRPSAAGLPAADPVRRARRRGPASRARYLGWLSLTGVALVLTMAVAVTIGPAAVNLTQVTGSVLNHLGLGQLGLGQPAAVPPLIDAIVWELRLPRVLTAAIVGAGLALSGAVMQSVTRNPLADPYL
ncbi:MAG: iron chelate uptake ABC transporter family permease subunit, partial [Cryobacterium sp.]